MKMPRPLLFAFLLLGISLAGCGDDGGSAIDGGVVYDARQRADARKSTTCSFSNCDGCCDGNVCNTEASVNKCGLKGQSCQTCDTGQMCFQGTCAEPSAGTCEDDCVGCCVGNQCLDGNTPNACGALGDACVTCDSGDACNGIGDCEAVVCDASNCPDGCCTANGECIPTQIQNVFECGNTGNACGSCADEAIDCIGGVCIDDQPCLEICTDGCCTAGGVCVQYPDQEPGVCGESGTCAPCTGDDSCLGGACTQDDVWTITINSAIVAATDAKGTAWDSDGSEPDCYVSGALTDDLVVDWVTENRETLTPNWDESVDSYLQSDLTTQGLEFNVIDSDFLSFEIMGNCIMTITVGDLNSGSKTIDCGTQVTSLVIDFAKQ